MFTHKLSQFDKDIVTIHPGEYHASDDDLIISTVLGSCVAVAFFDARLGMAGLNHFMLPGGLDDPDIARSRSAKYGMFAIELLYNEMMKRGARKADLSAKVFGGASVLNLPGGPTRIPKDNVDFAFNYLRTEGIPIVASDVGGLRPRKVFLFARTGKVLIKRFGGQAALELEEEEAAYARVITKDTGGIVELFKRN